MIDGKGETELITPTCHLCLVSDQPTPNLTPVLDRSFAPNRIVLLTSPEKQQQAEQLKLVIQPTGVHVQIWRIDNAMDIEHIRDRVFALLHENGDGIALNATGGTKPMSIAAYEVFRGLDLPIFYVHPERDRVIWMHPTDQHPFDIEERIRLPQFLQAHGVRSQSMNRTTVSTHLRVLTQTLIQNIDYFSSALGALNYLAFEARGSLKSQIPEGRQNRQVLDDLIELFSLGQLLECHGNTVFFADEDCRFFVNGGWLEQHMFSVIQQIRCSNPHIHDLAQGVEVERNQVRNELDVLFLCDNKLHLIECKTKQFKQGGSEAIYKLDALTDALGGLQTRSMLVSFQPLSNADEKRAKEANIRICVGHELQYLKQTIEQWIC